LNSGWISNHRFNKFSLLRKRIHFASIIYRKYISTALSFLIVINLIFHYILYWIFSICFLEWILCNYWKNIREFTTVIIKSLIQKISIFFVFFSIKNNSADYFCYSRLLYILYRDSHQFACCCSQSSQMASWFCVWKEF
jgi:hypothetical protein